LICRSAATSRCAVPRAASCRTWAFLPPAVSLPLQRGHCALLSAGARPLSGFFQPLLQGLHLDDSYRTAPLRALWDTKQIHKGGFYHDVRPIRRPTPVPPHQPALRTYLGCYQHLGGPTFL
jgi:hypothetical protein